MERELSGKVALITGASRGIGAAITRRVARAGADVVVHYHSGAAEAEVVAAEALGHGVRAVTLCADLSDVAEGGAAATLFDRAIEALGPPDILICNAGTGSFAPLAETTAEEITRLLAVNVAAPLLLVRSAARAMAPGGRIVMIGSVIVDMPVANRAAYAAGKGAVHAITGVLAQELGPKGIAINTVAPGVTATDRFKSGDAARAGEVAGRTALGRIGTPEEVAEAVAWLASPGAGWITGTVLNAHGGLRGL